MAERWHRALGTLDRMQPPPDLLDVARNGPRRPTDERPSAPSRLVALAAAAAVMVGVVALVGSLVDLRNDGGAPARFLDATAIEEVPTIPGESWEGLWPQVTRAAAEFAGTGPGAAESWQTNAEQVASAYVRDVFGWRDRLVEATEAPRDAVQRSFTVVRCTGEGSCDRDAAIEVTVEPLLRGAPVSGSASSYWFVTGVRIAGSEAAALEDRAAADLLRARAGAVVSLFIVSRLDRREPTPGSDAEYGIAERYLSAAAERRYAEHVDELFLYGAPDGHPRLRYQGFDIVEPPASVSGSALESLIQIHGKAVDGPEIYALSERLVLEPVDGEILITHVEAA